MSLSIIVAIASVPPTLWSVYRLLNNGSHAVDFWIALWVAFVGVLVAGCATEKRCSSTTWLLGKCPLTGKVPLWSFCIFWPYVSFLCALRAVGLPFAQTCKTVVLPIDMRHIKCPMPLVALGASS